jgi:hypothetical protein
MAGISVLSRLKSAPHFVKTHRKPTGVCLHNPPLQEEITMRKALAPIFALLLVLSASLPGLADTIRLKDGTVIRGQVIGFKDQQFTVLLGAADRGGRRSRVTLYTDDVESIEFDSILGGGVSAPLSTSGSQDDSAISQVDNSRSVPTSNSSQSSPEMGSSNGRNNVPASSSPSIANVSKSTGTFFTVNSKVRGDDSANGWTNTGLVVRRGQRLRISATGRVGLGAGRFATPAGLPSLPDTDKLMKSEATGALIAVIGDDNDDFILVGSRREFTAQRDGVLFLGVNEGNLKDNVGAFEVAIEAEAMDSK